MLGSNILNILLILGIAATIHPISVQRTVIRHEIPFLILITILLPLLGLTDGSLGRIDGIILWVFFLLYLLWLLKNSKAAPSGEEDEKKADAPGPLWKSLLMIVIGGVLVVFGSDVSVNAATALAKAFGMSDRIIGLTIVALGTSLPELVTSSAAAKKGNADMALGNVIGSNLFNILFVLGSSAVIAPVSYPTSFLADSLIGIAACCLLLSLLVRDFKLQRSNGICMLAGFAIYYVWLFLA